MLARLDARLLRLEAEAQEAPPGQDLTVLLEWGQRNGVDEERLPLADLTDAALDAKITALTGPRGLSRLLRDALEEECTRRQGAQGRRPQHEPSTRPLVDPAGTARPGTPLHVEG